MLLLLWVRLFAVFLLCAVLGVWYACHHCIQQQHVAQYPAHGVWYACHHCVQQQHVAQVPASRMSLLLCSVCSCHALIQHGVHNSRLYPSKSCRHAPRQRLTIQPNVSQAAQHPFHSPGWNNLGCIRRHCVTQQIVCMLQECNPHGDVAD